MRRPALRRSVGQPGLPHGAARPEPPVGLRLVARQRVRVRLEPRGRGRLGPSRRPVAAAALRGRDPLGLDRGPGRLGPHLPDVPADLRDRRACPVRPAATPADHVRVPARDGQLQRDAGGVLGRDRVHARAPGRVHLGVVGPRARPDAARRLDPVGLRRRLRRRAQRRQLLHRRPGLAGPDPQAGVVGAPDAGRGRRDRVRRGIGRPGDHEPAAFRFDRDDARRVGGHGRRPDRGRGHVRGPADPPRRDDRRPARWPAGRHHGCRRCLVDDAVVARARPGLGPPGHRDLRASGAARDGSGPGRAVRGRWVDRRHRRGRRAHLAPAASRRRPPLPSGAPRPTTTGSDGSRPRGGTPGSTGSSGGSSRSNATGTPRGSSMR